MAELDLNIDKRGEIPVYVQLKNKLKLALALGMLKPGEKLPLPAELAPRLGINANTVNRVYRELEQEEIVHRRQGAGTFAAAVADRGSEDLAGREGLRETLRQLKSLGYGSRQIIELTVELLSELD